MIKQKNDQQIEMIILNPPWSPCIPAQIATNTLSPSFTPTGKGGICFSSNFYCRVRDEDHSVRVVATPDRVPPECLEPLRFYNCHDRVSDAAVCTRAGLEAKLQGFHIIRGEILKT